ncbi:hypothetical protein DYB32_007487 [Aphanomyces invadans]|nr:hypothetical protein DYB32_007487 [Aphanomyces invadans]
MDMKPHTSAHATADDDVLVEQSNWMRWYLGAPGTVLGTVVGIVLVVVLKQVPVIYDMTEENSDFAEYFHGVGVLYFRALTCVTIPLAFINVAMCVSDMVASKMKRKLQLLLLTTFTTACALAQGLFWCYLFTGSFDSDGYMAPLANTSAVMAFQCPSLSGDASPATLRQDVATGALVCGSANDTNRTTEIFSFKDFPFSARSTGPRLLSFPSTIDEIKYMVNLVVPNNMASMLMENNVMGVVTVAIMFGIACGLTSRKDRDNRLEDILREFHAIFKTMLSYVIAVTPVAIIPLIAAPLLAHTHTVSADTPRLAAFLGTFLLAATGHCVIVLPLVLLVCTGTNPMRYMALMKEALVYGFSCSSSSKSVPVATRSMDGLAGNRNVARFAASIGTCINKSGGALYVCMALIWTFHNAGLGDQLTFVRLGVVSAVSLVASLAIPPVRTGGVAIVVSLFTFLSGVPITYSYSFLLVAECILDPLATVINLWGNVLVARIISFNSVSSSRS